MAVDKDKNLDTVRVAVDKDYLDMEDRQLCRHGCICRRTFPKGKWLPEIRKIPFFFLPSFDCDILMTTATTINLAWCFFD